MQLLRKNMVHKKGHLEMRTFGLCTRYKSLEQLSYEGKSLVREAEKYYDEVFLIDTRRVTYQFHRGKDRPEILYGQQDLSRLSSLHIRSTKEREISTSLLVNALAKCGCKIFDPLNRFPVGFASKLLTSIDRFLRGVGTSTYVAFNYENALHLLNDIESNDHFPLIAKPYAGKQGRGITVLANISEAYQFAKIFFEERICFESPLFLQDFISFVSEYRALLVDGEVLGIVKKNLLADEYMGNTALGVSFSKVDYPELELFLKTILSGEGILGVDIGLDKDSCFHIIEQNRAPQWQQFEKATGINVAQVVIRRSLDRI